MAKSKPKRTEYQKATARTYAEPEEIEDEPTVFVVISKADGIREKEEYRGKSEPTATRIFRDLKNSGHNPEMYMTY